MKILVGYILDFKHSGIDKYLLTVIEAAQKNGVGLDFLTNSLEPETEEFLASFGSRAFVISTLKNPFKHYSDVKRVLKEGCYDLAYFNISEPLNMMGVKAAHDLGIKTYIHSHASNMDKHGKLVRAVRGAINSVCRRFLFRYGDRLFACSDMAGKWLYPKRALRSKPPTIIYNTVDDSRFAYSPEKRNAVRESLGISDDTLVITHVGHFCYLKNNFFLIDIIRELLKLHPDSVLLMVGDGPDKAAVKQKAEECGVIDRIRFLGVRGDIPDLLSASDVFLLPSRSEGLSVVAVESQFSGVPCIFSDALDKLTAFSPRAKMLPITDASEWAQAIMDSYGVREPIPDDVRAASPFRRENGLRQIASELFGME